MRDGLLKPLWRTSTCGSGHGLPTPSRRTRNLPLGARRCSIARCLSARRPSARYPRAWYPNARFRNARRPNTRRPKARMPECPVLDVPGARGRHTMKTQKTLIEFVSGIAFFYVLFAARTWGHATADFLSGVAMRPPSSVGSTAF